MAAKSKCDCLGLAKEWEADLELRDRIRDEKVVLKKGVGEPFVLPTRANAVSNSIVLLPLLGRLAQTPKWALPHLDDLEIEVRTLSEKCGLNPGEKGPYQVANEIKKMMVMIKRKARRSEVTKDSVVYFQKMCMVLRWDSIDVFNVDIFSWVYTLHPHVFNRFTSCGPCAYVPFGSWYLEKLWRSTMLPWQDLEFHVLLLRLDPTLQEGVAVISHWILFQWKPKISSAI